MVEGDLEELEIERGQVCASEHRRELQHERRAGNVCVGHGATRWGRRNQVLDESIVCERNVSGRCIVKASEGLTCTFG